jgi:hypothetical protein
MPSRFLSSRRRELSDDEENRKALFSFGRNGKTPFLHRFLQDSCLQNIIVEQNFRTGGTT